MNINMKIVEAIGLIGLLISPIIIVAFVIILYRFFVYNKKIKDLDKEINKGNSRRISESKFSKDMSVLESTGDSTNLNRIYDYMEDFNQIQVGYSVLEQLIPVFPLLGILGTVAGLIPWLDNIEMMKEGMSTSMITTFLGLIAAITLKVIDALIVGKAVNKMNAFFDLFDLRYQKAKDKAILENEK